MPSAGDLVRALDELERIQRSLGEIARRTDDARAQDLINLRRAITALLGSLADIATSVFGACNPELEREFRQRLSTMRSGAAYLQASWPAVAVRDDTTGDYARAVAKVRQTDAECVNWMRAMVARAGENG